MSTIADLFKNFNSASLLADLGGSAIGALAAMFGQAQQYKYNKRLQDDAQEFNSNEAALNRNWQTLMNRENNQFNAAQSELAREWQELYYLNYQSPQAMMRQYQDAGLNPVLAAGHATNTPPSVSSANAGSAPGGAAASSGMNSVGQMDLVGSIASIMKLKAEIDNIKADTEGKKAGAAKDYSDISLNSQNIKESESRISKLIEETKSEDVRRGLMVAQTILANADAKVSNNQSVNLSYDILRKQFDETFKDKFGTYPATNLYETIWNAIKGVTNGKLFGIEFGW